MKTIICSQCGAVLPAKAGYCRFCDTSFSAELPAATGSGGCASETRGNLALEASLDSEWRAEISHRLASYRARRRKLTPNEAQTKLPFEREDPAVRAAPTTAAAVAEHPAPAAPPEDDFAFTIAIGRCAKPARDQREDARMEIDVSLPLGEGPQNRAPEKPDAQEQASLYPVAPLAQRGMAAVIDLACLLFAYGGFLALFGSMGGQFTLSKLSAAVYTATIALFYLQYFALFTVFGGTTPGMMLRGIQVVSVTGEPPTPQQLVLRSAGYVLSAGSFFLGFLWAYWDEDHLTWQDRISRTYLTTADVAPHAGLCDTLPHV